MAASSESGQRSAKDEEATSSGGSAGVHEHTMPFPGSHVLDSVPFQDAMHVLDSKDEATTSSNASAGKHEPRRHAVSGHLSRRHQVEAHLAGIQVEELVFD